jgi:sn-glycerol 3-phosphate transport system substrate-binding protein
MPQRPTSWKRSSLLTALLALALVAASCGGDDENGGQGGGSEDVAATFECPVGAHTDGDGPVEVTVWHAYNAVTQETLEGIASDYNASQDDVEVSVEAQGTYEELLTKYETAIGDSATLPDAVFAEDTNLQFLIDSGTIIPAESCIDADEGASEFFDDVVPSVTTAYTVQDALWPAGFGVSMPIMYVNDDHLRQAGVDTEEYPGTLDELRAAAEQIQEADLAGLEAPVVMTLNGWFLENWLTGAGQPIVDNSNGRAGLATGSEADNDSTREVFEWLRAMSEDGLLKTFPTTAGFDQYFALARQTSSILIDGSRAITSIVSVIDSTRSEVAGVDTAELDDTDLQGLDVNVAPIAGLESAGQGGVAGSAGFLVAGSDDASVAGAWDFFRFFNSIDNQVRWTLEGSYLPVTNSAQEDPRLVEEFSTTRSGRWLATAYDQLQTLDADFPGPAMGPYKEFRTGVQSAMEEVAEGRADPATAVSEFDAAFQSELESYAREVGG